MADEKDTSNPSFIIDDIDVSDPNVKGWDGSKGPQLPAGEYTFEVVGADIEPTSKGDGRQIVLDLMVIDEGDYKESVVKQWITLPSSGHKDGGKGARKRVVHIVRDVLNLPLLPNGGFEGKDLIGRQMVANVSHETSKTTEYNPATNSNDVTEKVRMVISQERPVAGAAPQATPAAAAAQPARPANAAAAAPRRPAAAPPAARR